jgi:hypothetical protein
MRVSPSSRILLLALVLGLTAAACNKAAETPEIKSTGIFTFTGGNLVEMRKLGMLGTNYGPRLYPELPEYDIPVVTDVGPMYVNIPDFPISSVKGIEWHGYRLGGNTSAGTRSTATPQEWKSVTVVTEPTKTAGLFKITVETADAKTGRWKPEANHEYFGLTLDRGFKDSPIWAVKIK